MGNIGYVSFLNTNNGYYGAETAGSVARANSGHKTASYGGETAGSVASASYGGSASSSGSCGSSFSAVA